MFAVGCNWKLRPQNRLGRVTICFATGNTFRIDALRHSGIKLRCFFNVSVVWISLLSFATLFSCCRHNGEPLLHIGAVELAFFSLVASGISGISVCQIIFVLPPLGQLRGSVRGIQSQKGKFYACAMFHLATRFFVTGTWLNTLAFQVCRLLHNRVFSSLNSLCVRVLSIRQITNW